MPLDAQLAELLSRAGGLRLPSYRDLGPEEARRQHSAAVQRVRAGSGVPEPVAEVRRMSVSGLGVELPARLYRPRTDAALPCVVYLHGGGWVLGDLDSQDATCRRLANIADAAVLAVGYRLAPEHPYPMALDDAVTALDQVWRDGDALGADPGAIAVAGSSAGANIAAAATLRWRDEGRPALAAQLLLYPPTDPLLASASVTENAEGYYLTAEDMQGFVEAYLPDPESRTLPYAGPLHADNLAGLPPAVVTTAGFDPLRDEGVEYVARLRGAGVPVTHLHYPDLIHGYFGFAALVAAAARAREEVLGAFAQLLADRPRPTIRG